MIGERKAWQGLASLAAAIALSFGISFGTIWSELSIGNNAWSLCNCVSGLTQWAMPTFVCIMGSIFLTSPNPIRLSTLWRRFIPSSFLSCIIWWLASSVVIMHNNHPQDLDFLTFRECMAEALEVPAYIGFCHMLVSFFILYPLSYYHQRKARIIHDAFDLCDEHGRYNYSRCSISFCCYTVC